MKLSNKQIAHLAANFGMNEDAILQLPQTVIDALLHQKPFDSLTSELNELVGALNELNLSLSSADKARRFAINYSDETNSFVLSELVKKQRANSTSKRSVEFIEGIFDFLYNGKPYRLEILNASIDNRFRIIADAKEFIGKSLTSVVEQLFHATSGKPIDKISVSGIKFFEQRKCPLVVIKEQTA